MFKIGKPKELTEEIEIFLTNCSTYRFNQELKRSEVEKEYKEINFGINGSIGEENYSLTFMFDGPVENLLELEKHNNYDITKFLLKEESFLGINNKEYYNVFIKGNILRFSNNKYIIEITFNTEDNEYFGYLEFDFTLDEYLEK